MEINFLIYNSGLDKFPKDVNRIANVQEYENVTKFTGESKKYIEVCRKFGFENDYNRFLYNSIKSLVQNRVDICIFQEFCHDKVTGFNFDNVINACYVYDTNINCTKNLTIGTKNDFDLGVPFFISRNSVMGSGETAVFHHRHFQIVLITKNDFELYIINSHARIYEVEDSLKIFKHWIYLIGTILTIIKDNPNAAIIICGDKNRLELVRKSTEKKFKISDFNDLIIKNYSDPTFVPDTNQVELARLGLEYLLRNLSFSNKYYKENNEIIYGLGDYFRYINFKCKYSPAYINDIFYHRIPSDWKFHISIPDHICDFSNRTNSHLPLMFRLTTTENKNIPLDKRWIKSILSNTDIIYEWGKESIFKIHQSQQILKRNPDIYSSKDPLTESTNWRKKSVDNISSDSKTESASWRNQTVI